MNHPILTFALAAIGAGLAFAVYLVRVVSRIRFEQPQAPNRADRGASERPGRRARAFPFRRSNDRLP